MLLLSNGIAEELDKRIARVNNRIWIATAFCKAKSLDILLRNCVTSDLNKKIVVRWQLRDIISGSSDLDLYNVATSYGFEMYVNLYLHAKSFLIDTFGVVGSANLTNRGMAGIPPFGNIELATTVDDVNTLSLWFIDLFNSSTLVNQKLFDSIKTDVESIPAEESCLYGKSYHYSDCTSHLLKGKIDKINTNHLFWTASPHSIESNYSMDKEEEANVVHDISLLNLARPISRVQLLNSFVQSPGYMWLISSFEGQVYFGELSSKLHDNLADDPKPMRKSVKILVSNIFGWARFFPELFVVDRPGHSERICKIMPIEHM